MNFMQWFYDKQGEKLLEILPVKVSTLSKRQLIAALSIVSRGKAVVSGEMIIKPEETKPNIKPLVYLDRH